MPQLCCRAAWIFLALHLIWEVFLEERGSIQRWSSHLIEKFSSVIQGGAELGQCRENQIGDVQSIIFQGHGIQHLFYRKGC